MESNKAQIIEIFKKNVLGKQYNSEKNKHCGSEGHWLETNMSIKHNNNNGSDILGYEMKSKTSSKVSFGDWCPNINEIGKPINKWWNDENAKKTFMEKYGGYNSEKNRWSWVVYCSIFF